MSPDIPAVPEPDSSPPEAQAVPAEFVMDSDDPGGSGRFRGMLRIQNSYSGPVPPPAVAEGWADLVHNAPERMLVMAEFAQRHQADMDIRREDRADRALDIASRAQRSESADRRIVILGLLSLAVLALLLGAWLISRRNNAGYLLILPAVGVLGTAAVRALRSGAS